MSKPLRFSTIRPDPALFHFLVRIHGGDPNKPVGEFQLEYPNVRVHCYPAQASALVRTRDDATKFIRQQLVLMGYQP